MPFCNCNHHLLWFGVGFRPVLCASDNGDVRILREILAEDIAEANAVWRGGLTPLHLASQNNHQECVTMLIRAGANYEARNDKGETGLDLAAMLNHRDCVLAHTRNVVGLRPSVALNCAVAHGDQELVTALLNAGLDPEFRDGMGRTAFHNVGNEKLARLLLERSRPDLASRDYRDRTPLYYARCRPRILMMFLAHGRDPHGGSGNLLEELKNPSVEIMNAVCRCARNLPKCPEITRPDMAERYREIASKPRSLQHYSRCAIRDEMTNLCLVDYLHLPERLKRYILFEWSDEALFS